MVGKYQDQVETSGHRSSETSRFFQTIMTGGQWALTRRGRIWQPPTDVYETDSSIVVKVEVAGMAEDDFEISFADHTLVIAGIRRDPSAKLGYHQMEILYGEFRTDVYIPKTIDVNGIEAAYKDGFLLVILPKTEPHRVTITGQ